MALYTENSDNQVKICTISTIKTSLENTKFFVNYHLGIGINRLYLFFDDPCDVGLNYYKDHPEVIGIKCDENHWLKFCDKKKPPFLEKQKINATYALELARIENFTWIAHIDCDEFIYSNKSINKILSNVNPKTNIVYLRVYESLSKSGDHENLFENMTHFKESKCPGAIKYSINIKSAIKLLFYRYIYNLKMSLAILLNGKFTHGFIVGHEQGKCFLKTTANVYAFDVHYPLFKEPQKSECLNEMKLLHFEAPSFTKFYNKWLIRINGSQNYILGSEKEEYLANLYSQVYLDKNAAMELYTSLYIIPPRKLKLLQKLGLIRKVKLLSFPIINASIPVKL